MQSLNDTLYQTVLREGLTRHVWQWTSLATLDQYRLPFERTLEYLRPGGTVLDWGCGNGHVSFFLTRHGFQTVGLSFDEPPELLADQPLFHHVPGDDPVRLPFDDGRFAAAVSMGVLEHVHETGGDQRASLAELSRVLEPGGTLLVFHLPNRYTWIEWVVRMVNPWLRQPMHQHSRLYTRAEVQRLLPPELSIVECGRYNIVPRNPLHALPVWVRDSPACVAGINLLDDSLTAIAPVLAQNWFFILRKAA